MSGRVAEVGRALPHVETARGAAANAIPMPASVARIMKSSSITLQRPCRPCPNDSGGDNDRDRGDITPEHRWCRIRIELDTPL